MSQYEFKRLHQRKKYGVDIVFACKGEAYRGIVINLSLGGAFIATTSVNQFSAGDSITLNIPYTTGKKSVKRKGLIKWLNNEGFAIEFF